MSEVVSFDEHVSARSVQKARPGQTPLPVFFDRIELSQILQVYGQMVAKAEWRDYAIGHDRHSCVFAIYHRTTEKPVYRIAKEPKLANRQGAFSVLSQNGRILKRGKTLSQVLKVFDKKRLQSID
ncbi:DUF2794 domain-containing protein [Sneathiella chinensis]|uniref:DUF2794 domain-containing protein n=1 Tax=Sneathiella chinensis TaxID=349750 RepID=A0ABQ5U968_9PROT|nr:DUF2794 domain-containing protein [Sneathiella chinensis]GLQ07971.1 hypothetical protein GCM10007924_31930 [Sneathiella chinensis]